MKKLLIATNVLLLITVIVLGIKNYNILGIQVNPTTPCEQTMYKSYLNVPLPGVTAGNYLNEMSDAYAADPNKANITEYRNEGLPKSQDALSVTFNIDQIKNLVWQIEHTACLLGCISPDSFGIRVYYIKYSPSIIDSSMDDNFKNLITQHPNVHSLAMVPVYKKGGEYYDFDFRTSLSRICSTPTYVNPKDSLSILKNLCNKIVLPDPDGDNHGGIGPPPFDGTYPTNPPAN